MGHGSQSFYLDDRVSFQEDLTWLVEDSSQILQLSMNHRELQAILEHPLLKRQAEAYGLKQWPHLVARLWDVLFQPTPLLQTRLLEAVEDLGLSGHQLPWRTLGSRAGHLALHFRAGNESGRLWWDPSRHTLDTLPEFLRCAAVVEKEIGLPSNTPWFLSSDTFSAMELQEVKELHERGKLVLLDGERGERTWHLAHVDRSHANLGLQGFVDSYVAYLLLASAQAVVLSRSFFGETAAEIGAVPHVYFAEGCEADKYLEQTKKRIELLNEVEQLKETAAPLETSDEQSLAEEPPPMGVVTVTSGTSELKQLMTRCLTRINEQLGLGSEITTGLANQEPDQLVVSLTPHVTLCQIFAFSFLGSILAYFGQVMKQIWKSTVEDGQIGVAFSRFPLLKTKLGAEKELRRDRHRKVLREARDKARGSVATFNNDLVHVLAASVSLAGPFREMDANGDGDMDSQEFSLFFLSVDREILEEAVHVTPPIEETALRLQVTGPNGMLSEDVFCQMMRSYCKVVKETVLTKELKVSGDNAVRRVSVDEVPRIKARCLADDAEGWLTLRGQLTLRCRCPEDWHALFRILRDVPLTANFERPADPKFLERFEEMEETTAPAGDPGDDSGPVDAMAISVEAVGGASEEGEGDGDAADAADDDLFDPESPEGNDAPEAFHEEHVEYQLLQHVDSPEHEDPDEGFRRLRAGELVEVLEWPANHLESGLTRMKVVALTDKATGWITQTNVDGVHFAEPH
eukprot:Skav234541  [mRNA]  locus=scaffold2556:199209:216865:- [translate_table: standard]